MKFKLDENLGRHGVEQLIRAGHDVVTVAEQRMTSATDTALIAACRAERRCLVTLDLDFANPVRFEPGAYTGIAVLRLGGPGSATDLEALVATLVQALSVHEHGRSRSPITD